MFLFLDFCSTVDTVRVNQAAFKFVRQYLNDGGEMAGKVTHRETGPPDSSLSLGEDAYTPSLYNQHLPPQKLGR